MAYTLRSLKLDQVEALSIVDKGANPAAKVVLFKRADPTIIDRVVAAVRKAFEGDTMPDKEMQKSPDMMAAIEGKLSPEEMAYLKELMAKPTEKPEVEVEMAAKPEEAPKDGGVPVALPKSPEVPEDVKKRLDEGQAAIVELAKMRDEKETIEFEKRAEQYAALPGMSTKDLGAVLKRASKQLDKADFESLEKSLKCAAEAVKKSGVLGEVGTGAPGDGSAKSRIESIAKRYMEADAKLSRAEATTRAMESNPELYREYKAEMSGK
jgi:hypothetical protein